MAAGQCQLCGSANVLVHSVPHVGLFGPLCSVCVLRHNPGSFCPVCFDAYDDRSRPAAHSLVMCLRCPALAHLTCLPSASLYLCRQCSDPSFSFADPEPTDANGTRTIDFKHLCAAKIAALSMLRAAVAAKADAEQKLTEAQLARRDAREALSRVSYLMSAEDDSDVDDGNRLVDMQIINTLVDVL